ncbi:MAG TPA: DsbA family oxidoreductase [Ktedonobacterales bacterium]|nr:DsbA family oxidoreductase [Ktedonobacterales bacterium]
MKVEIWSDVVCPWCYIGKRRFESALSQFPRRDEVEVTWRSFQLDPSAARNPEQTVAERLAGKYGVSLAQAAAMNERVSRLAALECLDYHLDEARGGNTFDAHRLIHLAASHGLQQEMEERLFHAYFTEGKAIGDVETLVALAAEVGLDADEARTVLASDAYADAVRADERRARTLGISGVPFFVLDEKYGVSGAQPAEVLREALDQVWAESHPFITPQGADQPADACEGDACALPEG